MMRPFGKGPIENFGLADFLNHLETYLLFSFAVGPGLVSYGNPVKMASSPAAVALSILRSTNRP